MTHVELGTFEIPWPVVGGDNGNMGTFSCTYINMSSTSPPTKYHLLTHSVDHPTYHAPSVMKQIILKTLLFHQSFLLLEGGITDTDLTEAEHCL